MTNHPAQSTISYSEQLQLACKEFQILSMNIDVMDASSKPIPGHVWEQREQCRDRIIKLALAGFEAMGKRAPR